MENVDKFLLFLCAGAFKKGDAKLSYRVARYAEQIGLASIGTIEKLTAHRACPAGHSQRIIFLNDCKSGCVQMLTHGIDTNNFIFVDLYAHAQAPTFNVRQFVHEHLIPLVQAKWRLTLAEEHCTLH